MKVFLLSLLFFMNAEFVRADLGQSFESNCETPDVKSLTGNTGSCRVVVAPKNIETKGTCRGMLTAKLACVINYSVVAGLSEVNVACSQIWETATGIDMSVQSRAFNVATLIQTSVGEFQVRNDPTEYLVIENELLRMSIFESRLPGSSLATRTGAVSVQMNETWISLKKVSCY